MEILNQHYWFSFISTRWLRKVVRKTTLQPSFLTSWWVVYQPLSRRPSPHPFRWSSSDFKTSKLCSKPEPLIPPTSVSKIVPKELPETKESKAFGKETEPTLSDISQLKPWTSHWKTTSKDFSEEPKRETDTSFGSWATLLQEEPPDPFHFCSSTLLTTPELGCLTILNRPKREGKSNLTDLLMSIRKLSLLMVLLDYIEDSLFHVSVLLFTEVSISEPMTLSSPFSLETLETTLR